MSFFKNNKKDNKKDNKNDNKNDNKKDNKNDNKKDNKPQLPPILLQSQPNQQPTQQQTNREQLSMNDKLQQIVRANEKIINKTPEEIRQEKLKELNSKLLQARSMYESAPKTLSDAEKEYYVFKDGKDSYNLQQLNKYKKEAENIKSNMLEKHNDTMQGAFQSLAYYDSQRTFVSNINEIQLTLLVKIKNKLKEINSEKINKNTNDRKTYYIIQEQETFDFWVNVLNHAILAFTFTYVFYCFFENMIDKFTYIVPIVSIIIVLYLETVMKLIYSIPLSVNVYASWGEENTSSFSTMIWIVILSAMLYFAIKYNNDKLNSATEPTNTTSLILMFGVVSVLLTIILTISLYVKY